MAPEILVPSQRLKSATFDDLKKVDIWAFGMVMYNLLNPNLKYPYQLEVKAREITIPELLAEKNLPRPSTKYEDFQNTVWRSISLASARCLQFDPSLRPSVTTIKDTFQSLIVAGSTQSINQGSNHNETASEKRKQETVVNTRYF